MVITKEKSEKSEWINPPLTRSVVVVLLVLLVLLFPLNNLTISAV